MDDPLVKEQTEAGAKFLGEFQKYYPVRAAFWLYDSEDGGWRLYVASDKITDRNFDVACGKAVRAARAINDPWFDVFLVKVIGADHRLAKAAVEALRRYPMRGPGRFPCSKFAPNVEGVFLYPQVTVTA